MSVDIRRMTKEEIDRLNVEGKKWRERNKAIQPVAEQSPTITQQTSSIGEQLPLL